MKMDLEQVFKELGQFGRYQVLQYALLTIPIIASAFEEMSYIFTSSQVDYRCLVPECESANATEFSPPWLDFAVPYDEAAGEPRWCLRYATRPHPSNYTGPLCAPEMFLTNETQSCDQWVFRTEEKTSATEFNLLCEDNVWQRTMIGTVNNLGLITNYIIICYISDRFGRRLTLLGLILAQGSFILLESFSTSYEWFIIFEYLFSFCSTYNTAFVLAIEVVGGDKRIFANCLMNTLYSVGEMLVALIMWVVQDFRTLLRIMAAIKWVNLLYLWMVSESIHWHLTKENYSQVIEEVKTIARINKKSLSPSLQHSVETLQAREEKAKKAEVNPIRRSVLQELLRSPPLICRFIICSLTWLVSVFIYFGFSLMSVTLAGNKYVNFILMALVEVPAYLVMWLGMEHLSLGRKTTIVTTSFLAAVPCFLFLFVPQDADITRLCLSLVGKFAVTISYTVIYEVGAELFPTELRQSMVGLCCAVGCVGGLFAPQIPLMALYVHPMLLFFWLSVASGCLALMLPETKGHGLPGTIMQAVKLG